MSRLFERTCRKYGVDRYIRFNEEVASAEFRDGRWQLRLAGGERDEADVIIAATGVLHVPSIPHIEGMDFSALNEKERQAMYLMALHYAHMDGRVKPGEQKVLDTLAGMLEITPEQSAQMVEALKAKK